MNEMRLALKEFKEDMRVMYEVAGRPLLKGYAMIYTFNVLFILLMREPLGMSWLMAVFLMVFIATAMLGAYLLTYFTHYRDTFRAGRKE